VGALARLLQPGVAIVLALFALYLRARHAQAFEP
jgi:hypothetical protein